MANYIHVISLSKHPIVMLGDLNLPKIDWLYLAAQNDGIHNLLLYKFVLKWFHTVTYRSHACWDILDIILTTEPTIISKVSICEPFSNSDHSQV